MEQWKEYKLSALTSMSNGRKRPQEKGQFPVYGGNGIMDYTNTYNAQNVIIVGRVGAYCGCIYRCSDKCWVSDNAIAISANDKVDMVFLYYLMQTLHLNKHHIGGAQPLMTQDIIGGIDVNVPSLEYQNRIADVLSSLDAKIELNRQINDNLERQAQALFRSWFVVFEPFGGVMPKEWKMGNLLDVAELYDYKRKPLSSMERDKMQKIYPYYGATSIMDYVDNYIFDGIYLLMGEDGSVINEDGSPYLQYVFGKFWANNHAHVMRGKNGFSTEMLHCLLLHKNISEVVTGAVQAKLSQSSMGKISVPIPPAEVCKRFSDIIVPFYKKRINVDGENMHLASLRDSLLPRLMSGELKVNEINA